MHSVSIVIPAYNEEKRLPATLDAVFRYLAQRSWSFSEVVVVDDGSSDSTAALAENYTPPVRLLRNPGNRGKGYSVRHGMLESKGEWILFSDADLSAPIEEFDKLLAVAVERQADVVLGSRAVDRSLIQVHQSAFREYGGRFFNVVMRTVTGLPFHDTQCGFKLYRAEAARKIFERQLLDGFSFDVEDLFIAKKLGFRAVEHPVRWSNVEGTKVTMWHSLKAFLDLLEIRRNQMRGKYK